MSAETTESVSRLIRIPAGAVRVEGLLAGPEKPAGIVVFAHGSGSSRLSPRNNFVAAELRRAGFATLLLDLLTAAEDRDPAQRFDIALLTARLGDAVRYLGQEAALAAPFASAPIGLFGASTGAAAALRLAATEGERIRAVVSRGGRPDLAGAVTLTRVRAPTLFIVGGLDAGVIELNQLAFRQLGGSVKELSIVPGATHLFEEPGSLEQVATQAGAWFSRHFGAPAA